MNNKGVGAVFCLIAAVLTGARYVAAAIYFSSTSTKSPELFRSALEYTGSGLTILSVIALVAGVGFLVWGTLNDSAKAALKEKADNFVNR